MEGHQHLLFVVLGALMGFSQLPVQASSPQSASPEYLIDVWDTERGLPHSTVTSIAQTPDGYLWVGTLHGGLARFDGVRFVTFHPGNTPALRSIEIQRLLVDARGTLWIGTVEGMLLSLRDGAFRLERRSRSTPQSWIHSLVVNRPDQLMLSTFAGWLDRTRPQNGTNRWETLKAPGGDRFSTFCEDHEGRIWYRTKDAGLGMFAEGKFSRVPTNCGLTSLTINALTCDAAGRLWVGTDKEIAIWDGRQFVSMTPTNGPPELEALQLAFASDGGLWVRSDTQLRKCFGRRWVVEAAPWDGSFRPTARPLEMYPDAQSGIWLAHSSDGLWHVDRQGHVARISEEEGLPTNQVECWFRDREGNVWVGLSGGGLVRLRHRTFNVVWTGDSLREQPARSVCEDAAGAMWFGGSGGTFLRWENGRFTKIVSPTDGVVGRDGTVCPDATGRVWLGSVLNGVWVFETNGLWQPFPATRDGNVVRALFGDLEGRMWIGNEFGLFVWEDGQRRHLTRKDGLKPAFVTAVTKDQTGMLWIGTANGELRRYDYAARRGVSYKPKDASPVERFWALLADKDGVIWVGTLGGGLLRFKDGKFTRYTTRDGLPNEHVSQILEDGRGQLWLGTRAGITRVNKQDLEQFAQGEIRSVPWVTYGKSEGLPTMECSGGFQPSCWRSRDGRLWFATVKGIVSVQPKDISFNPLPPPVVIEEVLVDGKSQNPTSAAGDSRASRVPRPPAVEVSPGRHNIEIRFTGLSFSGPGQVRFKYRLEGLESDWIQARNQRSVTYNLVPPGQYRFCVLACNGDGVWSEASATLALVVRPFFWQTWWFKLVGAVVLVGGAGGAIGRFERRKVQRKLQRLQQQRALERERIRIAKDIHDDLGASLTRITLLSDSARNDLADPARTESSLDRIAVTARDLTRTMDEIVWAVNPKHDRLDSLVNYLGKFAQDFLSAGDIAYRLDVPPQLPRWPLGSQVRHNLFLAFKEALHNVVKHAAAKQVRVVLTVEAEGFLLAVLDNGRGFVPGAPHTAADSPSLRLEAGNGLANMKTRLEGIGGHCEVRSAPGAGTSVTFVVPVKPPE